MALQAGSRLGPYEVISLIGAGGMGEVYQARDTRLDRNVAVKVLAPELAGDAEFRSRFNREAKAISSLNHPHICGLYSMGRKEPPKKFATFSSPVSSGFLYFLLLERVCRGCVLNARARHTSNIEEQLRILNSRTQQ